MFPCHVREKRIGNPTEIVAVTLISTREIHLVNLSLKSPREISFDQVEVICRTCFVDTYKTCAPTLIRRSLALKWRCAASWSRRCCLTSLTPRRATPAYCRWCTLLIQEYQNIDENKHKRHCLMKTNSLSLVFVSFYVGLFWLFQPSIFCKFILAQYFCFTIRISFVIFLAIIIYS